MSKRAGKRKRATARQQAEVRENAAQHAARQKDAPRHGVEVSPAAGLISSPLSLNISICVLLAVATFAVYSRALGNAFVNYDDIAYVTNNPWVQQGLTKAALGWAFVTTTEANWHPLTWLSHALDCQLFGLHPAGHHLTSVLLHLSNVVLLFLLLQRVTKATGRSLLVAALFAFHPINVESVAWIAERKNVLSMFFFFLALAAYGWYTRRPGVSRYLLLCLCFVLGLTAKPMIVTLPFVLLLLDFWPLARVQNLEMPSQVFRVPQAPFGRLVLEKLPLLLLSAASSAVTLAAQRTVIEHSQNMTLPVRIVNALYAYCLYIVKAFWPSGLTAFYPYQGSRLTAWQILLCVLFLAGVTAWVWRARSRPYLAVGWFWFLGTLVPTLGLVQVGDQAMADRYAYLPMIGIFVMVVWGIADWAEKRSFSSRWRIAVAGLVLAVFALLTWRQIGFWRTSSDLWSHALQVTRDNYVAEDYAGSALLARYSEAGGQHYLDEALVHFQNAVRFNPRDIAGHLNLGVDLHQHGQWQEAIEQYKQVLALNPNSEIVIKTLTDLGAAYQQLGDYAASQRYYREALKMDPHNQTVLMNLGKLGMLARMQQLADAAAAHPSPQAYLQLGQLQEITGKTGAARASFEEALRLDPAMAEARGELNRIRARSASATR